MRKTYRFPWFDGNLLIFNGIFTENAQDWQGERFGLKVCTKLLKNLFNSLISERIYGSFTR